MKAMKTNKSTKGTSKKYTERPFDKIEKNDQERIAYNKQHGTNYSYGQYFSLKRNRMLPD